MKEEAKCEGDERTGVQVLKHALEAPTRQIAENSAVDGGVVVARMLEGEGNYGFDAARKEYVDLVEAGIIDPTKVVRVGLGKCRVGGEPAAADRGDDDRNSRNQKRTRARTGNGDVGSSGSRLSIHITDLVRRAAAPVHLGRSRSIIKNGE